MLCEVGNCRITATQKVIIEQLQDAVHSCESHALAWEASQYSVALVPLKGLSAERQHQTEVLVKRGF